MKRVIKEGVKLVLIAIVIAIFFIGILLLSNYLNYGTFTF